MLARLISLRLLGSALAAGLIVNLPATPSAHAADPKAAPAAADDDDEAGEGAEDKPDPDQPAVTAGGNYNVANTPISEVQRTLLMPVGGIEAELDFSFDLAKKTGTETQSFKTLTFDILGRYGATQTVTILGDLTLDAAVPDGVGRHIGLDVAAEIALAYDLIDVRVGVGFASVGSGVDGVDGDTLFDAFIGAPFKYRLMDKVAVLGLEQILRLHLKKPEGADSAPDLIFSLAAEANPIPALAVILRISLNLTAADFDQRRLPLELTIQYTLSHQVDIGLFLIARNLAPPSSVKGVMSSLGALDDLGMGIFVRGRF